MVINKSAGAGGEGFLDVKNSKGDDHKLIITLSNLGNECEAGPPVCGQQNSPQNQTALRVVGPACGSARCSRMS